MRLRVNEFELDAKAQGRKEGSPIPYFEFHPIAQGGSAARERRIQMLLMMLLVSATHHNLVPLDGLASEAFLNEGAWISGIRKARFRPLHSPQIRSLP